MELEDKPLETSTETPDRQPQTEDNNEIQKVVSTLKKERDKAAQLEKELKELKRREDEQKKLIETYKSIDPEKYQKLLEEAARRDEEDLIQRRQYEAAKENYKSLAEKANLEKEEYRSKYETTVIENAIRNAFFENGGRKPMMLENSDITFEDIPPVEAMISQLKGRVQLQDGRVVVVDRLGSVEQFEGRPKTVSEKIKELKQGSLGTLFEPENDSRGGGMLPQTASVNGKQVKVYTRKQAQEGKVPMSEIANGTAIIQG